VQPLCPVGLQDEEILDYLRQLLECERETLDSSDPDFESKFRARVVEDGETMDQIRQILGVE
jgi:hypothetical protein